MTAENKPKPKPPGRVFVEAGHTPLSAVKLIDVSPAERSASILAWQGAVFDLFGPRVRVVRLSWVLSNLFHARGHCFATNERLGDYSRMGANHVQDALKAMEDGGLIVRDWVRKSGRTQRRIWPKLPARLP